MTLTLHYSGYQVIATLQAMKEQTYSQKRAPLPNSRMQQHPSAQHTTDHTEQLHGGMAKWMGYRQNRQITIYLPGNNKSQRQH
ncbi:hypothetical protein ElyMa_006845300 [Elysia marginata]|uniref:Uncharacterized protein n=1 Tax=Elysia marginata TaxID=1093978 RepID=A0AAV4JAG1_9GAST|nr:hypothetical protein ElyMa_006845300 [Elysia marginata]